MKKKLEQSIQKTMKKMLKEEFDRWEATFKLVKDRAIQEKIKKSRNRLLSKNKAILGVLV